MNSKSKKNEIAYSTARKQCSFKELQFRLAKCTTAHFKCIIKSETVIFLSFSKNKETRCISVEIKKKIKRVVVSLSKESRSKVFFRQQNFITTVETYYKIFNRFFHKIFDNSHLKFGKMKKAKTKKLHVWQPVNHERNFFTN